MRRFLFYGFVFLAIQIKGAQLEVYLLSPLTNSLFLQCRRAVPFLVGMDKGYFIFCASSNCLRAVIKMKKALCFMSNMVLK